MHQDSNILNLIKDISNRPNRRIPEYGEGEEVRIDVDCPIAAEVGLRMSEAAAEAAGGRVNGGGVSRGEDGGPAIPAGRMLAPQDGLGPLRGEGGPHPSTDSAGHPSMLPGHASMGSHVTSHRSGTSSKSRAQGIAVGMDSGQLPVMHGSGGAQASTASPRRMPPSMALTTAGMEALLVTRAAAVGAVGGSGGTGRPPGSDDRTSSVPVGGPSNATIQGAGSSPAGTEATTTGTATPPLRAPGAQEGAALPVATATPADANRAAVQFAAADITERVMKSKDSGSEGRNGEEEAGGNPQVANLMDELEALRRDIMSGINDTQLQIMSVVGSGAFGTVSAAGGRWWAGRRREWGCAGMRAGGLKWLRSPP